MFKPWATSGRNSMNTVNELNTVKGYQFPITWIPRNWGTLVVGTLQ